MVHQDVPGYSEEYWRLVICYLPEENHVGEAVEPAVDNKQLHGDLVAAEEFHLILRILWRHHADVE